MTRYTPTFDFAPPATTLSGDADVTLAVISTEFSNDRDWARLVPWSSIPRSLSTDFGEILGARGYLVKGPFASYEQMVYPDKEGSDLILVPSLDLTMDLTNVGRGTTEIISGSVRMKGDVIVNGRLNFYLLESLTGTRMWVKDIAMTPRTIPWEMSEYVANEAAWRPELAYRDPAFANAVAPVLEEFYQTICENAWNYLNPDEVKLVAEQAKPVREKATAVIRRIP